MKKIMMLALAASLAVLIVACKKSPGKAVLQHIADALNKKDYDAFVGLLSKNTIAELQKGCDSFKAIPKAMVAEAAKAANMPEDLIANCTPAKILKMGMEAQGDNKNEKFKPEKIKSEKQDGNTITVEIDDPTNPKMTLVKEGADWKIDLADSFKSGK